jgi:hypothetical protein
MESKQICKKCKEKDEIIKQQQRLIDELLNHPTMLAGIRGEKLILDITQGIPTKRGTSFDLKTPSGMKVEVKYSRVTYPVIGHPCKRWVWGGLLRKKGEKDYDILVLLGEKDGKFHKFEDDGSSFVFFILTKSDVKKVIRNKKGRGNISLNLNPNPISWKSHERNLWKYRVSPKEAKKFLESLRLQNTKGTS